MTKRLKRPRDPLALAKLIGDIATGQVDDRTPDDGKNPVVGASWMHVPFVFLTGHSREMISERRRARPYLMKPASAKEILDVLSSAMAPLGDDLLAPLKATGSD